MKKKNTYPEWAKAERTFIGMRAFFSYTKFVSIPAISIDCALAPIETAVSSIPVIYTELYKKWMAVSENLIIQFDKRFICQQLMSQYRKILTSSNNL